MNAIYRFRFAAVVVRPQTRKGRGFDTDRVDIKPNPWTDLAIWHVGAP
ncbi:hypothetical protein AB0G54_26020 [Streptomyces yokosukanensis]|nr:hypothetical protein [Streptomyces yokosukanensis]